MSTASVTGDTRSISEQSLIMAAWARPADQAVSREQGGPLLFGHQLIRSDCSRVTCVNKCMNQHCDRSNRIQITEPLASRTERISEGFGLLDRERSRVHREIGMLGRIRRAGIVRRTPDI